MPKQLMIAPSDVRAKSRVEFTPVPVNQYDRTVTDELAAGTFTKADLLRIQRDMEIIRGFETMLNEIKLRGQLPGHRIQPPRPGAPVDRPGSRRRSARRICWASTTTSTAATAATARFWPRVCRPSTSSDDAVAAADHARTTSAGDACAWSRRTPRAASKDLAIDYLVYGALAEIFGREAGFNKGLGRLDARLLPAVRHLSRTTPSSADPATSRSARRSTSMSTGSPASSSATSATPRPAAARSGKALLRHDGPVQETLGRSASRRTAADHELRQQLLRHGRPAGRRDDGLQGAGPPGRRAEPRADARRTRGRLQPAGGHRRHRRKKEILEQGDGPVLLDTVTYRFSGHSPSDASSLPREGRGRGLAAGRSDQIFAAETGRRRRLHAGRHRHDAGVGGRAHSQGLQEGHRSRNLPARGSEEDRLPAGADDVLQPAGRDAGDRRGPRCCIAARGEPARQAARQAQPLRP